MKELDSRAAPAASGGPHQAPRPPRLLLIATLPWMFPARLANALREVGFHVEAVCRPGNPLRRLRRPIRTHTLGLLREAASIEAAIQRAGPDLLLPCDDPAVQHLHCLHKRDRVGSLAALIEHSLGDPDCFDVAENRSAFVATARSMGFSVPCAQTVADRRTLAQMSRRVSYPCVLKRDQTWSGIGVAVARNDAELDSAWSWIAGGVSLLRAGKAGVRDRRIRTLLDALLAPAARIELQEYVAGVPANRAVVCRDGRVLAGLSVIADCTAYPGGPASVVRAVEHGEMADATRALVARLGLSGFCGFDFIVTPSGRACLLELNPRATPISHLATAGRSHLPAALYRETTGREPASAAPSVPQDYIALFPTEWQRDPTSPLLRQAYHDAPWDEPALLAKVGLVRPADLSVAAAREESGDAPRARPLPP